MRFILVFLSVFAAATMAAAQDSGRVVAKGPRVVADKIVGRVGDLIILQSDISNALSDAKRQGGEVPPEASCFFMERLLIQKALVLQAAKDSLKVGDEELDALLDNQIREFIRQYGSKETLEEIAGKSVYQIKEDLRQPFLERKLAEMMQNSILDNIKVTPAEVKQHYEQIPKDSLPFYESELEIQQLVLFPKPNTDVEEYVVKELYEFKRQAESGKSFDQLVKLYSQDPGKEQSLTYNLNRNDKQWDPTFFNTAFRLKEGQISPVIKSKFGYHIIKLISRNGDDAVVSHVLRIPEVSEEEITIAKRRLDSIAGLIRNGQFTFTTAINKFTEDENAKFTGGSVTNNEGSSLVTIDQLDKELIPLLKTLKPGEFTTPMVFKNERGKGGVRMVYLKSRTEPHRENLKDDYNRIAARALQDKKGNLMEKWFASHIPNYYILIDDQFGVCENIAAWKAAANKTASR